MTQRMRGIIVASPSSRCGKTTVTLGLLRALARRGKAVRAAKSGPDYIDVQFHQAASGAPSVNLDAWAMHGGLLKHLAAGREANREIPELLIVEGAMGVLDGAGAAGEGSVADLARSLGLPIVLVIDASRQSHSSILAPMGLAATAPDIRLAGVIANRTGSDRHGQTVRNAVERAGLRMLGVIPRDKLLELPERHLGLVMSREHPDLLGFLDGAADCVEAHVDLNALTEAADTIPPASASGVRAGVPPLGQRISMARDDAFAFTYEHLLADWRRFGAEIDVFSPLSDEEPDRNADAVFLPGGYPELHGGTLARCRKFRDGMVAAAERGARIYGECGGYMVLGRWLEDAAGDRHKMLGLLPNSTSFSEPRLSLGYRLLESKPGAPFAGRFAGHEFHYARLEGAEGGSPLFSATDADGGRLPDMGHVVGNVSGSFAHLICAARQRR